MLSSLLPCLPTLHTCGVAQNSEPISSNLVSAVKEWEVLAQESLDAVLEPGADTAADESELGLNDASITWRGDGKYFATVSLSAGKSPFTSATPRLHGITHAVQTLFAQRGCELVRF